ncbi:MAG: helix-turn-helix transcriptional regulator [Verrucomicrobia bacterium]|nr:helix-turn-helix transcriptional regulator [Verrucomicrobiota bacterium]
MAAVPFSHLALRCRKPRNDKYLWFETPPDQPSHIGEHIKKRRLELKLKAAEVQRLFGIDKGTLADWEHGKHTPSKRMQSRIVRFLGYDPFESYESASHPLLQRQETQHGATNVESISGPDGTGLGLAEPVMRFLNSRLSGTDPAHLLVFSSRNRIVNWVASSQEI